MSRARSVLLILLLLAGSLSPPWLHAQEARDGPPPERTQAFRLEQNYPNPVNSETWIPFYLEDSLFANSDSAVVTIRIFNILQQAVAHPKLVDQTRGRRAEVINLSFRQPGRKIAYWDGKDLAGRLVPSGVYYCQLVVNGESLIRRMTVYNPRRRGSLFPWFGSKSKP